MIKDAIPFDKINHVLIVKLRHHGDVLLSSPVFQVLKNHHPHLQIDALVYQDTQEMLTEHPAIRQVYTIDRNWKKLGLIAQFRAEYQLLSTLKSQKYDLMIHLTEHNRGVSLKKYLKPSYAVSAKYSGKKGRTWKKTFTHLYPTPARQRHTVEKHLDSLRRIGLSPNESEKSLVLVSGHDASTKIDDLLVKHQLKVKEFIHIHPTSRWLFKCWDVNKMATLIDQLQANQKQVVITAAPVDDELNMVKDILSRVKQQPVNLSGELSLKELSALTAKAACFMGMDSVPMHIAAAVATPVVVLFGPSGDQEWGPWAVPHEILTTSHSCRPCGQDGCGGSKVSDCLMDINTDQVFQAINARLNDV
ncbi:MAG: putative lipopolysaccharide heptosyltransferase III [Methylococcales bacterium]|jgi:heptosyltransferase III|nr:putative lipopolysaccharide heptosyltransferase III [Methylococcales bacterium]MBT7411067.1 putative lipopolysaccharide heptosyltransferase III [Methylococcales bacterium]